MYLLVFHYDFKLCGDFDIILDPGFSRIIGTMSPCTHRVFVFCLVAMLVGC